MHYNTYALIWGGVTVKLQQLQYVISIEQFRSIRKAAQSLFISEPAISKSLSELEKEYGIVLFERSRSGMTPTREGEEFLQYARAILEQCSSMEKRFQQNEQDAFRCLKIDVRYPGDAVDALINVINKVSNEGYNIVYRMANTSTAVENIESGSVDLAVIEILSPFTEYWKNFFKVKKLDFIPLGKQKNLYIAIREAHPLANKRKLDIKELDSYAFIDTYADHSSTISTVLSDEAKKLLGMRTDGSIISVHDSRCFRTVLSNTDVYAIISDERDDAVFKKNGIKHFRINTDIQVIAGVIKKQKRPLSNIGKLFIESLQGK